jgi:SMODS and SLOG-associating 2TM effector domain family 4
MFGLSIVDHVRLNLARTTENYTVHARAAERLARLTTRIRISVLALSLIAVAASIVSLIELGPSPSYRIVTVVAASVAFAAYAGYLAFGLEGRVHAHRLCAHKLWLVCERHRALLADIRDGSLDRATIVRRRDELVLETHSAYDQVFPLDERGYEDVRQSADSRERPDSEEARAEAAQRMPSPLPSPQNECDADGSGSLPLTG